MQDAINFIKEGNKYRRYKQFDKAEKEYIKALKIASGDSSIYKELGKLYYLSEDSQKALRMYLAAMHIDLHNKQGEGLENIDESTINNLAHAVVDFDEEYVEDEKIKDIVSVYKAQIADDKNVETIMRDYNLTEKEYNLKQKEVYSKIGKQLLIRNIKWKAIDNIDVMGLYINDDEKSKKYSDYLKSLSREELISLTNRKYEWVCNQNNIKSNIAYGFGSHGITGFITSVTLLQYVEKETKKLIMGGMNLVLNGDISSLDFDKYVNFLVDKTTNINLSHFVAAYMHIEKSYAFDKSEIEFLSNETNFKNGYTPIEIMSIVRKDNKKIGQKIKSINKNIKKKPAYYHMAIASCIAGFIIAGLNAINSNSVNESLVASDGYIYGENIYGNFKTKDDIEHITKNNSSDYNVIDRESEETKSTQTFVKNSTEKNTDLKSNDKNTNKKEDKPNKVIDNKIVKENNVKKEDDNKDNVPTEDDKLVAGVNDKDTKEEVNEIDVLEDENTGSIHDDSKYRIYIGVFSIEENAISRLDALNGFEVEAKIKEEEEFYKVCAGEFDCKDEAFNTANEIKEITQLDNFVDVHNKTIEEKIRENKKLIQIENYEEAKENLQQLLNKINNEKGLYKYKKVIESLINSIEV